MVNYILQHGDGSSLKKVNDESIDLIVTSPPYDGIKAYKKRMTWNYFKNVTSELYRVVKQGGTLVWIVGDVSDDKGGSFRQAASIANDGFLLHDIMIYKRPNSVISKVRYNQSFDYMFIFSKGIPKTINLIQDKPYSTKRGKDKYTVRDNIWNYAVDNELSPTHLSSFPLALAIDHIKSWSNEGDIVLDPFLRSGTTGVAAMMLNRKFIGFEKDRKYLSLAQSRMDNWEKETIAVGEPCFSDELYEDWDS